MTMIFINLLGLFYLYKNKFVQIQCKDFIYTKKEQTCILYKAEIKIRTSVVL